MTACVQAVYWALYKVEFLVALVDGFLIISWELDLNKYSGSISYVFFLFFSLGE